LRIQEEFAVLKRREKDFNLLMKRGGNTVLQDRGGPWTAGIVRAPRELPVIVA